MSLFKDGKIYRTFDEQLAFITKQVKDYHMVKIEKTSTVGLTDNYTITYQDGRTSSFQIVNGNGIKSITKTSTVGLVDTYTILFDNNSTTNFTITNGEKGDTGAQGIQGEKGEKGDTGAQGIQGDKGEKGVKGDKGDKGDTGDNGVSITNVTASQIGTTITLTFTYSNGTTSTTSYNATGSGINLNTYTKTFNSIAELENYIRLNIDKIHKIKYTPNVNIGIDDYKYIELGANSYSGGITSGPFDILIANKKYEFVPQIITLVNSVDENYVLLECISDESSMFVHLFPMDNSIKLSYNMFVETLIYGYKAGINTFANGTFNFVILGTETNP